jgi:hypothetical protein
MTARGIRAAMLLAKILFLFRVVVLELYHLVNGVFFASDDSARPSVFAPSGPHSFHPKPFLHFDRLDPAPVSSGDEREFLIKRVLLRLAVLDIDCKLALNILAMAVAFSGSHLLPPRADLGFHPIRADRLSVLFPSSAYIELDSPRSHRRMTVFLPGVTLEPIVLFWQALIDTKAVP